MVSEHICCIIRKFTSVTKKSIIGSYIWVTYLEPQLSQHLVRSGAVQRVERGVDLRHFSQTMKNHITAIIHIDSIFVCLPYPINYFGVIYNDINQEQKKIRVLSKFLILFLKISTKLLMEQVHFTGTSSKHTRSYWQKKNCKIRLAQD